MSHATVTEVHLHSNKYILVKRVPENVLVIPISFLLHQYLLNNGLILCLLSHLEYVDSSQCNLDQRESSRYLFDSSLESSWCDFCVWFPYHY